MCVCVREGVERERVCVCERERERECVCVCIQKRVGHRESCSVQSRLCALVFCNVSCVMLRGYICIIEGFSALETHL